MSPPDIANTERSCSAGGRRGSFGRASTGFMHWPKAGTPWQGSPAVPPSGRLSSRSLTRNLLRTGNRLRRTISHEPRRHRSEEHTSELQSLMRISYAVFCLKKKKKHNQEVI